MSRTGIVVVVTLLLASLAACTGEPAPEPTPAPTADETSEPAPSGVQVGVVLPARGDPMAAAFLESGAELDALAEERVGDVARVRAVEPDDVAFVPDVAALLADEGADLVCVLGSGGARIVLDLADRFPASSFCAFGSPRESQPGNVILLDVAHEELGHVLGTAVGTAAGGAPVGLVLGSDDDERARRRVGARAALADLEVAVDALVQDAPEAAELATAAEDAELAAVIVDVADAGVATVLAATAPRWVGPRGVAIDASAGPALVRWSLRADRIVSAAVDELIGVSIADEAIVLGFADDVFTLTFAEDVPDEVRSATEGAAGGLARGVRDPLGPLGQTPSPPVEPPPAQQPADGPDGAPA